MIDFSMGLRINQAMLDLFVTGLRSAEMLVASGEVIGRRSEMIQAAIRAPHKGNYAELRRMVPEKVDTFGEAANILGDEWRRWQDTVLALSGRAACGPETVSAWTDAVTRLWAAPAAAMRPIHKAATGNSRRLRRRRTSR